MSEGLALLGLFLLLLALGVPLAVALGLAGAGMIWWVDFGLLAVPTNAYAGVAKYPLLAIPMFILAGVIFERAGVAARLVRFASSLVGQWSGSLAVVAVLVSMLMGGISGSGAADAAAVAAVMIPAMHKRGYPRAFSAGLIAAAGSTAIVIPPSIAFIVYSVLVPQATVPALFAAGLVPGLLVCLALVVPAVGLSRYHGFDRGEGPAEPRPAIGRAFVEAIWGLLAPVIILGGMRLGLFTPSEAAVVAVAYGLLVGVAIYRTLGLKDIYSLLVEAAEISGVVLMIIALASVFAWAGNTLGAFDALAGAIVALDAGEWTVLLLINLLLLGAGMFLDAISVFLILLPLLVPIAQAFGWDLVWFGVIMTLNLAIGQFTPPMAINLMVTARIGRVPLEATVPWVIWMVLTMVVVLLAIILWPPLSLWLPQALGYS